jgi:hypothetical protein
MSLWVLSLQNAWARQNWSPGDDARVVTVAFGVVAPTNEMGAAPQQFIILFHAHC